MTSDFDAKPAEADAPQKTVGASAFDVLGDYRIVEPLGAGGMGCVYLATDEKLHRTVALKVLQHNFVGNDEARERFFREARAAAALKHDNIVTIYQVGEDQGIAFLAMEHLEGKSLEDWLRPDRRASLPQTFSISKQIARALAAAHQAQVIHRDIKPDNIWLEPNGRVKILDFGIAHHATATSPKLTQTGAVMGTPAYMSPEQARGEQVDHRSDLFSFGCVLYRMVTGRLPFQAEGVYGVIAAIMTEQQVPAHTLNPAVPKPLSEFIDRLLSKSRDDRPPSAQAILKQIKEWESLSTKPTAVDETMTYSSTKAPAGVPEKTVSAEPPRKKWGLIALPIGLAILGIAIWFAVRSSDDPAKADSPEVAKQTDSADKASKVNSTPAVENSAEESQVIDLLADVDLENKEKTNGFWWRYEDSVYGRRLNSKSPKIFGLPLPCPAPFPEEYCFKLQAERISPATGAMYVTLTAQSTTIPVGFDGNVPNRKGVYYGIVNPQATPRAGVILNPKSPVDLAFWVSKDQLRITANDKEIYNWKGNFAGLKHERLENMPEPIMIGGDNSATFRFSNIKLVPNVKFSEESQEDE